MKDLGGIILYIIGAVLLLWVALKLLGLVFHLLFIALGIALGVFVYFLVQRLVGAGR